MKRNTLRRFIAGLVVSATAIALFATSAYAGRSIIVKANPDPALIGRKVNLICIATGDWPKDKIQSATMSLWNASGVKVYSNTSMTTLNRPNPPYGEDDLSGTYKYTIPETESIGMWRLECTVNDGQSSATREDVFRVTTKGDGGGSGGVSPVLAHQTITSYNGPSTCIACHPTAGTEMLNSLHMKWAGPTPNVTNGGGAVLGKAIKGINTFCSYAMSSKGACFNCHVRSDGNAPHAPTVNDVDCLMCHNDTYVRKFVVDPNSGLTVTNVLGITKTYYFGITLADGSYVTEPDFFLMPPDITMVDIAKNVHRPTRRSCLRCHAKAGGSDWAKRGDMGVNSAAPTADQDVHMSQARMDLTCTACHKAVSHKIGGRGIDLRQTETANPFCQNCHTATPHTSNSTMNRHAVNRVACQVCHIRTFGKGGATEMSRDWKNPVWSPPFCNGQGGFVGEEIKITNVKPEYVWFNGTSYVYNIGEIIKPNAQGIYNMAKANGAIFDGKSRIVPIKRHASNVPLHSSGKIVPPMIMWMFMTGDFDKAVQEGMKEQGMTGSYTMVNADAEMLITHGVEPKVNAPACATCHDYNGTTPDGTKMIPFDKLGYHVWPAKVKSCTLCHVQRTTSWEDLHSRHAKDGLNTGLTLMACTNCHTKEPIGLVKPQSDLCNDCHKLRTWGGVTTHNRHVRRGYGCATCHKF
jgi:hypothetical protein